MTPSLYEVIGGFAVVLFTCVGIATIGGLALYGGYRLLERHLIGQKFEQDAVRELLEVKDLERLAK